MTEIKKICPSCKTKIEIVFNPENIEGNSICICSNCMTLLVMEDSKLRKMTYSEICSQYKILVQQLKTNTSDILLVKLRWIKRAMIRFQAELATLN